MACFETLNRYRQGHSESCDFNVSEVGNIQSSLKLAETVLTFRILLIAFCGFADSFSKGKNIFCNIYYSIQYDPIKAKIRFVLLFKSNEASKSAL
jgi:hypothetical protein